MYRKGLSSRANKVSSLVASIDNSGPGSVGQDSVPTAGAHGIRKNVFRRMPALIPKKSLSRFSKMAIPTRPYPFFSKQHLSEAIVEYFITNHDKAWRAYGHIGSWNTAAITDMSSLFTDIANGGGHADLILLTENELSGISNWNVSNVTNMSKMFLYSKFNGDLSNWNVSKVTDFSTMFTSSFFANDTILKWDVRSGTNFTSMFQNGDSFTTNLRYWNITSGATLTNMFTATGNIEVLGNSTPNDTPDFTFFNKITIILNGTNGVAHERTQKYNDAGAFTLTGEIPFISSNNLDVDVVNDPDFGPYEIIYAAENPSRFASGVDASTETRRINVVDSTLPVITLTGPFIVTLERGDTYTDHGATATEGLIATNNINTAINDGTNNFTVGTYDITYEATDTVGLTGTKTRTINVVDTTPPVITFPENNYVLGDGTAENNYNGSSESNPLIYDKSNDQIRYSGASATDDATALDINIDLTSVMTNSLSSIDLANAINGSIHIILYEVSDTAGNESDAERIIKVMDTIPT
jgi:surface protein